MLRSSVSARDALARSDVDPASVMMVRCTKVGVVCPVAIGICGWPQMFQDEGCRIVIGRDELEGGTPSAFGTCVFENGSDGMARSIISRRSARASGCSG